MNESVCSPRSNCLQLLGDHIKVVLFTCSEYEAKNYGAVEVSNKISLTNSYI